MFRSYFEENGTTAKWKTLYRKLNDEQKERLMAFYNIIKNTLFQKHIIDVR